MIVEHKQIMDKALECSLDSHWKEQYLCESQLFQELIKTVSILLNLCLKYNFTNRKEILESISKYITKCEGMERAF